MDLKPTVCVCVCVFYLFIGIVKGDYKHHITSLHLQFIRVVGGIIVHNLDLQQSFPHTCLVGLDLKMMMISFPLPLCSRLYLKQESWRHFCSFRCFFCWMRCSCGRLMRKRVDPQRREKDNLYQFKSSNWTHIKESLIEWIFMCKFSYINLIPDAFAHLWRCCFLHCGWSVCCRLALESEGERVRGERVEMDVRFEGEAETKGQDR